MTREQWIEKQVEKKSQVMWLDNHSKSTLRSMLRREWNHYEQEVDRIDNTRNHDDY